MMRQAFQRGQWTVGMLASLGLGAMACSTTNSDPSETGMEPVPEEGLTMEEPATSGLRSVYFDLDSAVLREDGRASLDLNARQIRSNPEWGVITIEGHCDERGNDEYNLALGERRAGAVKQYLADLGVPQHRLKTLSYGELEPASLGHDELAWSRNRRAQLETSD